MMPTHMSGRIGPDPKQRESVASTASTPTSGQTVSRRGYCQKVHLRRAEGNRIHDGRSTGVGWHDLLGGQLLRAMG